MVVKLCCLMASSGYHPGVVLPQQDQAINKAIQDCHPIFPCYGARHEIMRIGSLNLRAYEGEEAWKPISGLSNPSQFVKIESAVKSPLLTDVQALPIGRSQEQNKYSRAMLVRHVTRSPQKGDKGELLGNIGHSNSLLKL
ncbi:hypothetical protein L484_025021 [Morus notabilis]|uniref:Uncharacterized protein n=1 Tax=Morus notabilis TaxID=981085 RepID=W9R6Y8_9ROSA|nr:hypothetical protein L484_025021 [Morus notabilis]